MTHALLQLSDLGLGWRTEAGQSAVEFGVSYANEGKIVSGALAWQQLWLQPHHCYTRYWQQFNQNALQVARPGIRHHADIVFHQLQQLCQPLVAATGSGDGESVESAERAERVESTEQLVVIPPSHFREQEHALLLAITQSLNLTVSSFVDAAVCHVAGVMTRAATQSVEHVLYVDVQLHQTLLIDVYIENGRVTKGDSAILADSGLLQVLNTAAHQLADLSTREHRIDPLKLATTSQDLYQQIYDRYLHSETDFSLELETDGRRLSCHVTAQRWQQILLRRLNGLIAAIATRLNSNSVICLNEQGSWLKAYVSKLAAVTVADMGKSSSWCFDQWQSLAADGMVYVDSVELSVASTGEDVRPNDDPQAFATHLLVGDIAYSLERTLYLVAVGESLRVETEPVTPADLVLHNEGGKLRYHWQSDAILRGDPTVSGAHLNGTVGEAFTINGKPLRFISVEANESEVERRMAVQGSGQLTPVGDD